MSYVTAQELREASVDAGILEKFANGALGQPNINRKGDDVGTLRTIKSQVLDVARQAANLQTYLTKLEADAARPQPKDTVAQVTNDPNPANNGHWVSDGVQWHWSEIQPATQTEFNALNTFVINRGKNYPLRPMVRDGVFSAASPVWNALVLDAKVINARPGKLYQLSFYQNGAALGPLLHGWIIREFDEATYGTAAGEGVAVVNFSDQLQTPVDRNNGIQQISLHGTDGIEVHLVVDPAALPDPGLSIDSNSSSSKPAWSWVIDPACYVMAARPVAPRRRNGVSSDENDFLRFALLDVLVVGARPGKVYGIRYFKNGTSLLPGPADGWEIEEQGAGDYATSGDALKVFNYVDPAPDVPRGGVQTVRLNSPVVSGLSFIITLDTDKLPPYGDFVRMNSPSSPGYSWVIDPEKYTYAPDGRSLFESLDRRMQWRTTADRRVILTFQSSFYRYRVTMGPNGRNGLPNFISVETATSPSGPFSMTWQGETDWLPPLIALAVFNGVMLPIGRIYTGGNHGSDGSSGGDATARNVMWDCVIDGAPVPWVEASGLACSVDMRITNDVMAANTVITVPPRYAIREFFRLTASSFGIGLCAHRVATEDINLLVDSGIQATTAGFRSEMMYVGGDKASWTPYSSATNSGTKQVAPDAWAVALRSGNGQLVLWQDREYEAGDARYISEDAPVLRGGGENTHKVYGGIAGKAVLGTAASFAAGESWSWRGGWSIQAPDISPDGIDAVIQMQRAHGHSQAVISDAQNWVIL